MDILYNKEKDIFELKIDNNVIFYNDYSNECSIYQNEVLNHNNKIQQSEENIFFIKIIPSNACNLNCTYCFSENDRKSKQILDYTRVQETIEKIAERKNVHFSVAFTGGGEPTTNLNCIKHVVEAFEGVCDVTFNITSNGIFERECLDYLIERKFNVAISIDGNYEIARSQQTTELKVEKYNQAIENAIALQNAGLEVSILTVLSKDSIEKYAHCKEGVKELVLDYFYNIGFNAICINFDKGIFSCNNNEIFLDKIVKICEDIVEWKKIHKNVMVPFKYIYSRNNNYNEFGFCRGINQMSQTITIMPNGKYSFCHKVQLDELLLNEYSEDSIKIFFQEYNVKELRKSAIEHKKKCKTCISRQICMGDVCPALLIQNNQTKTDNFCANNRYLRAKLLGNALKSVLV